MVSAEVASTTRVVGKCAEPQPPGVSPMGALSDAARRGAVIVIVAEGDDRPRCIRDVLDVEGIAHLVVGPADLATALLLERPGRSRRVRLAQRRKELGKSQEVLAREIGVERTTVARWECGSTEPSVWCRAPLAAAMGIPIEDLDDLLRGADVLPTPLPATRDAA